MDLEAVSEEIRSVLGTMNGLRITPWGVTQVQAPAALVALPDRVTFDETYGRGKDVYPDLSVVILVGHPEERASLKTLAAYAAGSGARSIKAKLEAATWATCDNVTVEWAEFDSQATYAGSPQLAAIFHCKIVGKGA